MEMEKNNVPSVVPFDSIVFLFPSQHTWNAKASDSNWYRYTGWRSSAPLNSSKGSASFDVRGL
ncbi:hypothetical protein CC80DRAFT_496293, partial [Byssothecium circinans]